MIGTLEYMSLEQAEMAAMDIDTRSDIHSLGVMLYELLTGSTPLEPRQARKAARRRPEADHRGGADPALDAAERVEGRARHDLDLQEDGAWPG